jgi:hypothetical protein
VAVNDCDLVATEINQEYKASVKALRIRWIHTCIIYLCSFMMRSLPYIIIVHPSPAASLDLGDNL